MKAFQAFAASLGVAAVVLYFVAPGKPLSGLVSGITGRK